MNIVDLALLKEKKTRETNVILLDFAAFRCDQRHPNHHKYQTHSRPSPF